MDLQGKEICRCGNPSGQYSGLTYNSESKTISHFWCADCGGTIKAPTDIKVQIRKLEKNKQCCKRWEDLYYRIIEQFPNLRDKIYFCPECKTKFRR